MKQVYIFQRRLTHYRVPLFEAMRERLAKRGIDLKVVFGPPGPGEESRQDEGQLTWGSRVAVHYFFPGSYRLCWHVLPWIAMLKADMLVLPQENALLANYPLMFLRWLLRMPTAFWGHGRNFQADQKTLREGFKRWMALRVDWWFAYTRLSVELVEEQGFPSERIFNLNNAMDVERLQVEKEGIEKKEKRLLRGKLGLEGQNVGVFLGSLIEEKRLGLLISAADRVRNAVPDFELLLIGDGPLRDYVKQEVSIRPWIRWLGNQGARDKVLSLSLGKVMLNPGMVGLGILDSFVMGIPMVTTDCGIHSPEIAFLKDGENGLVTRYETGDFANAVAELLKNEAYRQRLSVRCLADSQKYSLAAMTDAFVNGIVQATSR